MRGRAMRYIATDAQATADRIKRDAEHLKTLGAEAKQTAEQSIGAVMESFAAQVNRGLDALESTIQRYVPSRVASNPEPKCANPKPREDDPNIVDAEIVG